MNQHDPLELDSLPSDPRENILRLLGMTTSSLKELDSMITDTSSASLRSLKLNTTNVLSDAMNSLNANAPVQHFTPPVPVPTITSHLNGSVAHNQYALQPQSPVPTPQPQYDPNQLEFDFYKKIKPEDIEQQLRDLNIGLKKVNEKIDEVLSRLDTKKKATKLNGN